MKKIPALCLGLGLGLVSNNVNADADAALALIQLGKGFYEARKAQVHEARNSNMSASFFSSGTHQCIEPVGSVNIVNPEEGYWVSNLPYPTRILNKVIDDSRCFTIVDRGVGFSALERERKLALAGNLTNSESIAQSKVRGADYILIPGILIENKNAGGNAINLAGSAHDLVGNSAKGVASYQSNKKKAEVILTLMDVRSSEQILSVIGEAKISDKQYSLLLSGKVPQGQGSGSIGGWENTAMDEVLKEAYENAYKNMITEIGNKKLITRLDKNSGEVSGKLEKTSKISFISHFSNEMIKQNIKDQEKLKRIGNMFIGKKSTKEIDESFMLIRLAPLYKQPDLESSVIIELKKGLRVYSLGDEQNNMIKVQNELGEIGWIAKIHLQDR